MASLKVLLSGPCDGDFKTLYKKVENVVKKSGPFDVLFCVGACVTGDYSTLIDYVTGASPVPVTTYFLGFYDGDDTLMEALKASSADIHYLGRSGVTNIKGLNVAYLDGRQHPGPSAKSSGNNYFSTEDEVPLLEYQLGAMSGELDLLLTCEWPLAVTDGLDESALPEGLPPGSPVVSKIADLARPRYHVVGGNWPFFARPPYINRDLGAGARATRFISLTRLATASAKNKALHALALVPASDQDPDTLATVPQDAVPSPYDALLRGKGAKRGGGEEQDAGEAVQDWRWQAHPNKRARPEPKPIPGRPGVAKNPAHTVCVRNIAFTATEEDIASFFDQSGKVVNIIRGLTPDGKVSSLTYVQFEDAECAQHALQLNGSSMMNRTLYVEPSKDATSHVPRTDGKPVDGCWFCLASSVVDVSLVASVGEEAYLALDKGPITPCHVLLVPLDHQPSTLALNPSAYVEIERYMSALRSCFASKGQSLVAFERCLRLKRVAGGNHCHINAIAVPSAAAKKAQQVFEECASAAGLELTHLPASSGESARTALRDLAGDGEFFCALLPDGSRLVRAIMPGERWPLNLGREALARLAGVPERADWKTCSQGGDVEGMLEQFKDMFKPYDIMQ